MDNAADEPHEEPQDPIKEDVGGDSHDFLGGSQDTSVLTDYTYHVASKVWAREIVICLIKIYINKYVILIYINNFNYFQERIELKLASHGRKVEKFGRHAHEIKDIVITTELSSLITCSLETMIGDFYQLL